MWKPPSSYAATPAPSPRTMRIMLKVADLFFWDFITLSIEHKTVSDLKSDLFHTEFDRDDPSALADGPEDIKAVSVRWEGNRRRLTRIDDNNIGAVLFLLFARQRLSLDGVYGDLLVVEFDSYPADISPLGNDVQDNLYGGLLQAANFFT